MMYEWQPCANLRDYVSLHPPGSTFCLCLLSLSLSLICLRFYGDNHVLPNPDTTKDWNHLLSSLSMFQLCTEANVSLVEQVSPPRQEVSPQPQLQMDGNSTSLNSTNTPNTQLHLKVPLVVVSHSLKGLSLHTAFRASQLGLAGNETVNVTVHLSSNPEAIEEYSCLTISGPTYLLPLDLLPPECQPNEKNHSSIHVVSLASNDPLLYASRGCYSLQTKHDPALTVMLTPEDQAVAGRHLLEVSLCLLGVCLMLCLYASLTQSTRRHKGNGLDRQNLKEPLIDSSD